MDPALGHQYLSSLCYKKNSSITGVRLKVFSNAGYSGLPCRSQLKLHISLGNCSPVFSDRI